MNMNKVKSFLFRFGWIIVCACVAVFFVVALCVYNFAKPDGVSAILSHEEKIEYEKMCNSLGDLEEASPHVTKVYEYVSNGESVHILWKNDSYVSMREITYGVVGDVNAEYNYRVECFVYSDIADRELVRRTWDFDVTEGVDLIFAEGKAPYFFGNPYEGFDIRKESFNSVVVRRQNTITFVRVVVKPGYGDVTVEIVEPPQYIYPDADDINNTYI